jgi:pimeloyl-ACP methyl ester carboxylesterase
MTTNTPPLTIVLVHGAWADGSSWSRLITALLAMGIPVTAAPIPLTSLPDDVTALDRAIDRVGGRVVLVGHAYAGAVIGASTHSQVKALIYVAALAPDEGEAVADVFYRAAPHPDAPILEPDRDGYIWLPTGAFPAAFAQHATAQEHASSPRFSDRSPSCASSNRCRRRDGSSCPPGSSSPRTTG